MTHSTNISCPKCGYTRNDGDALVMKEICPSCGIVYAKWKPEGELAQAEKIDIEALDNTQHIIEDDFVEDDYGLFSQLKQLAFYTPEKVDSLSFYGRCAVYLAFFFWGWHFIIAGIHWDTIMNSFMHSINLPFHEFGHVLFSPFGRFMTILGGSLFQVLLPLGLCLAFMIQQRDTFAASMMLWWCGQSFIDLSPYIIDATERSIPLVGGLGEEAHDWGNLLTMLGMLRYDEMIAKASFTLGAIIIFLSWAWGAYLLMQQKKALK